MDKQKTFPFISASRMRVRSHAARLAAVAALLGVSALAAPIAARAEVNIGIGVTIAPPALPVYAQPPAPAPGYIWTPGYWAWGPDGYYWVRGVWLLPPAVGMLWTPGWWGWSNGYYRWHAGYWGPQVGFYGGINYGFGYFGVGYVGGGWRGDRFYYNRAVTNVNITNVRNVYVDKTVIHNERKDRISYNGGRGGLRAAPSDEQRAYAARRHQTLPSMAGERRDAGPSRGAPRPDRAAAPRQPGAGSLKDDGRDRRQEPGRAHGDFRAAPQSNRAPERPRMDGRPAAGPERPRMDTRPAATERPRMDTRPAATERPRQEFRSRESRPPRMEAPARGDRGGAGRPERGGEGHARQGRGER